MRYSPSPVDVCGCHGSSDRPHDGAQDAGHAVQVVDSTGVLDLQFVLQDGLREEEETRWVFWVTVETINTLI